VALIWKLMAPKRMASTQLVKAQFLKAAAARFNGIDNNHDGVLTRPEVQAVLAKHQARASTAPGTP
jgi:hypothetical protein